MDEDTDFMVEPDSTFSDFHGAIPAAVVIKNKQEGVYVNVMNTSSKAILIRNGEFIGLAYPAARICVPRYKDDPEAENSESLVLNNAETTESDTEPKVCGAQPPAPNAQMTSPMVRDAQSSALDAQSTKAEAMIYELNGKPGAPPPAPAAQTAKAANSLGLNEELKLSINQNLTPEQRKQVEELLYVKHKNFFASDGQVGHVNMLPHRIELEDPLMRPIKQQVRPLNPKAKAIVEEKIEEQLQMGVCRPSKSPWASPIVLSQKACNRRHNRQLGSVPSGQRSTFKQRGRSSRRQGSTTRHLRQQGRSLGSWQKG
jgi:hypothetical protein